MEIMVLETMETVEVMEMGGNNSGNGNRGNGTLQGTGVKTGDETPITALLLILAASAAVLGATVYKKQKRQAR